jgi:hypothetical protein
MALPIRVDEKRWFAQVSKGISTIDRKRDLAYTAPVIKKSNLLHWLS